MELFHRDEYKKWDMEKDIIVVDAPTMFSVEEVKSRNLFVFSVNTERGIIYQKKRGNTFSIVQITCHGETVLMKNSFVVASDCKFSCMIIRNNKLNKCYIVDSRGEFFELPEPDKGKFYGPGQYAFAFDKKSGCYKIQDFQEIVLWHIKAVSDMETEEYQQEIQPDVSLALNPEFKKFISNKKLGKHRYLCFTCDSSKQGQIVKWLMSHGLPYRIMPNIFIDDETLNIMVEVSMDNARNLDVLYLLSKYKSTYTIFGISIFHYLSAINSYESRNEFKVNLPKLSEVQLKMCDTIINTMKYVLRVDTDAEIYKQVLKPILSLFYIGIDYSVNKEFKYAFIPMGKDDFDSIPNPLADKDELQKHESSILIKMGEDGIKINKWKSENEMFMLIYQEFPEAVYQYHASWLGGQSLDVYLPNQKLAFEYQGIQHFMPVEFFGGEDAFERLQERDKRKKLLCEQNDVKLIYWNYDEPVNSLVLKRKIKELNI